MINQILKYFGFTLFFCVLFGAGFYFGFKTSQAQQSTLTATKYDIKALADSNQKQENIVSKEVEGVYWILPSQDPVCPETHKIKAKFSTSNNGVYYSPENKSYTKVQPQLCLATEDFAKKNGFIKKF